MFSLLFENWKSASLICHFRKDVQGIVHALKINFLKLQIKEIKEYHSKSDPKKKACNFSNVKKS